MYAVNCDIRPASSSSCSQLQREQQSQEAAAGDHLGVGGDDGGDLGCEADDVGGPAGRSGGRFNFACSSSHQPILSETYSIPPQMVQFLKKVNLALTR